MLLRKITEECTQLLKEYPVVTIIGPRQAGKTTLARSFTQFKYCNLESPENRDFATQDPNAFLNQFSGQVILDEIQRVPELLSYIQVLVDEKKQNAQFILTGSHQLALTGSFTQSLSGRTALLHLLPFSISELYSANIQFNSFEKYIFSGFLPIVGSIFENLVIIEFLKSRLNQGKIANLYFYRDNNHNEIDLIIDSGSKLTAIEIKSSSTYNSSLFKNINKITKLTNKIIKTYLVYSGKKKILSNNRYAIAYDQISEIM